MALKAMMAFTIMAMVWFGARAKAQTPCQQYVRLRNAVTKARKQPLEDRHRSAAERFITPP